MRRNLVRSHAFPATSALRKFAVAIALVVFSFIATSTLTVAIAAQNDVAPAGADQPSPDVADNYYVNTVRSTSLATPGAARTIPIDETRIVRGTILDAAGQKASGVEVWGVSLSALPPVRERALTDAEGRFELNLLPDTNWLVHAFKGHHSVDVTGGTPMNPINRTTSLQSAKLSAGCVMKCQVIDQESGQVIPGARVYSDDGRILISDTAGFVDMSGLKQGTHDVIVLARDYEMKQASFYSTMENDHSLKIPLYRAHTISGQIVNELETPLPNGWLARRTRILNSLAADGTYLLTNDQGRFAGSGNAIIGSGQLQDLLYHSNAIARAGADNYLSKSVSSFTGISKAAPPLTIVLREQPLLPQNEFRRDIDLPNGGKLYAESKSATNDYPTEEDIEGTHAPQESRDQIMRRTEVIDPQKKSAINEHFRELLKSDNPPLQGRIIDPQGKPLAGVRVQSYDSFGSGLFDTFDLDDQLSINVSDSLGNFSIPDTSSFSDEVLLTHDSYAKKIVSKEVLRGKPQDIQMEPRRYIRIKVADESGKPIQDYQATISPLLTGAPALAPVGSSEPVTLQCINHDGTLVYHDQWRNSGEFLVTIAADGMMDYADKVAINLDRTEEHNVVLKKAASLKLNVASAAAGQSNPIANITVAMLPKMQFVQLDNPFFSISPYASHSKSILDVPGQSEINVMQLFGTIAIQAPGFARQTFDWRAGTTQYDVKLVPESIIAGSIESDAIGHEPITVWLASANDRYALKEVVNDTFQFSNLSSGPYRIQLSRGIQTLTTSNVSIKPGERLELRFHSDVNRQFKLIDRRSSGNVLSDEIQYTVNGEAQRISSVDSYVESIKRHIAEKSPEVANLVTKQYLLEKIRNRLEQLKNNPTEMQYQGQQAVIMQDLISKDQWPVGMKYVYVDPSSDTADDRYIVLHVPTPEAESLEQLLIIKL